MTLPQIKENNVIALVQAVKQMENERDRIKRIPVSFRSYDSFCYKGYMRQII